MSNNNMDVFLGRQAVVDRRCQVVAYELLFRSGAEREVHITDNALATACVITNTFDRLGIRSVVGRRRALINVDGATLLSNAITALPPGQVVIELLETIRIDGDIVRRCRELKQLGYRLALDDFCLYGEEYEPLLGIVDIVKVDIPALEREPLARLVKRLKSWPPKLLAEKVESQQRARECIALGFALFQGFFFGRPVTLTTRRLAALRIG